jgi:hypothetical protein
MKLLLSLSQQYNKELIIYTVLEGLHTLLVSFLSADMNVSYMSKNSEC